MHYIQCPIKSLIYSQMTLKIALIFLSMSQCDIIWNIQVDILIGTTPKFCTLCLWLNEAWIVEHWRHCGIIHEQMKKTSGGFQKRSITYNMLVELGVKMIAIIQTATGGSLLRDPYHFMAQPATVFSCFSMHSKTITWHDRLKCSKCLLLHIDPKDFSEIE